MKSSDPKLRAKISLYFGLFMGAFIMIIGGSELATGATNVELYSQTDGEIVDVRKRKKRRSYRRYKYRVKYNYIYDRELALNYISAHSLNKTMASKIRFYDIRDENYFDFRDRYLTENDHDRWDVFRGRYTVRHSYLKKSALKSGEPVTVYYRKDKPWRSTLNLKRTRRLPYYMIIFGMLFFFGARWALAQEKKDITAKP